MLFLWENVQFNTALCRSLVSHGENFSEIRKKGFFEYWNKIEKVFSVDKKGI